MKTHRQELIEKLDKEFGKTVNATRATVGHLLLLCDMLDERADQFRGVTKKVDEPFRVKHANGYDLFMAIRKVLVSLGFEIKQPGSVHWGTVEAMLNDVIFVDAPTTKMIETPTNEARAVPINLVTRLHFAYEDANATEEPSNDPSKVYLGIRAVLSELAKADISELPQGVILPAGDATGAAHVVLNIVRPILAAKDAMIMSLQNEAENRLRNAEDLGGQLRFARDTVATQAKRIAELESHAATITAQANQYRADRDHVEETCRMHSERVIALEKGLEAAKSVNVEFCQERDAARTQVIELEKRIAELTAPMVVDGKTPGQTLRETYEWNKTKDYDQEENDEHAAREVLRKFGNGVETLKRARNQILNIAGWWQGFDKQLSVCIRQEDALGVIDAEIVKPT